MAISVEQFLEHEWPMGLDPDFDGCCPCATVEGEGFTVRTHCWRTSDGCKCQWSGVHVEGLDAETARRVAEHMRDNNGWTEHTDWAIVVIPDPPESK
jgi:hypothetical protein